MNATTDNIRRAADGSIDTAYYIAHSHTIRSHKAHDVLNRIICALNGLFFTRRTRSLYAIFPKKAEMALE